MKAYHFPASLLALPKPFQTNVEGSDGKVLIQLLMSYLFFWWRMDFLMLQNPLLVLLLLGVITRLRIM